MNNIMSTLYGATDFKIQHVGCCAKYELQPSNGTLWSVCRVLVQVLYA